MKGEKQQQTNDINQKSLTWTTFEANKMSKVSRLFFLALSFSFPHTADYLAPFYCLNLCVCAACVCVLTAAQWISSTCSFLLADLVHLGAFSGSKHCLLIFSTLVHKTVVFLHFLSLSDA